MNKKDKSQGKVDQSQVEIDKKQVKIDKLRADHEAAGGYISEKEAREILGLDENEEEVDEDEENDVEKIMYEANQVPKNWDENQEDDE